LNRRIFVFLPDVIGGVSSVINNIFSFGYYSKKRFTVIAYREKSNLKAGAFFSLPVMADLMRFSYNENDNLHHTSKQLRKIMGVSIPDVLIATDSLELKMVQLLRIDCKIVFIVLGDFEHYYQIAVHHNRIINHFIVISEEIKRKLNTLLPSRTNDISLAYFPTPSVYKTKLPYAGGNLRIIFVGRLEPSKQPLILVEIDKLLKQRGINVDWTIVGNGELENSLRTEINKINALNFTMLGFVTNSELHDLYLNNDVIILPSICEGLPVSLIEAMKTGLVPVVSDITGGIREIVNHGVNGYLCDPNSAHDFTEVIEHLIVDEIIWEQLVQDVIVSVRGQFDPQINSKRYFEIFNDVNFSPGRKEYGIELDRLDKMWIPTILTRTMRQIKFFYRNEL
jgi:glycosyltransferase involved in cell wall biosynthesis